jgi:hypothetical protein
MLALQDEEILKDEKKIRAWQVKFVGLQNNLSNSISDIISDQLEDMLLNLDEMKIKVEALKNPGDDNYKVLMDEIKKIDDKIDEYYREIQKNLFIAERK